MNWSPRISAAGVTLLLAGCSTTQPLPTTLASPSQRSATPTATPVATAPSVSQPGFITTEVAHRSLGHPAAWQIVTGPPQPSDRVVPLFYLANTGLDVKPCPTLDPSGVAPECPEPLTSLPTGGVLMTFLPNLGLLEAIPPQVTVEPASGECLRVDGEAQVVSVAAALVVTACLRAPELPAHEATVRAVIASLTLLP